MVHSVYGQALPLFRDTFRSEKEMWNIEDICQDIFWYLKYIFGPNFV